MYLNSSFWLADFQKYADTQGITKEGASFYLFNAALPEVNSRSDLTYVLLCTAALAWVKKQNPRKAAVYKISKQFCSGIKPAFKREINPLFITLQVAALNAQVMGCSQDLFTINGFLCLTISLIVVLAGCGLELRSTCQGHAGFA